MKRVLSILLTAVLLMTYAFSFACFADEDAPIYILAASDFQQGSHEGSAAIVSSICTQIYGAGYTAIDGFLFCGDYDRNTIGSASDAQAGLTALQNAVSSVFPGVPHSVYVQGNHDPAGMAGLSPSGNNDCEHYGVFVINNKDYMWYNSDRATIEQTAASLRAYLEEKLDAGYTKPIFVVSHLPLHYSARTVNDGDAQYADLLFNELNEAGILGLNVVYLYGHDHSNGWDNYLGGAAVYLGKGDTMTVAQSSRTQVKEETLSFTYMNAGYTGYYSDANGADSTMTMSLFTYTGGSLTVARYDANGLHNLKSAGTYNAGYDDRGYLSSRTDVVPSPQSIALSDAIVGKNTFEDDAFGVSAYFAGQGIDVETADDVEIAERFGNGELYDGYAAYTVEPVGSFDGVRASVGIPLDGLDPLRTRVYRLENGKFKRLNATVGDGRAVLETTLPATLIAVSCLVGETAYTRISSTADLTPGGGYLFSYNDPYFMLPQVKSYNSRVGFALEQNTLAGVSPITSDMSAYAWMLTKTDGGWLLGDGTLYAKLTDTSDKRVTATLESVGTTLNFASASGGLFTVSGGGFIFNFNESRLLINGFANNPASFAVYKYSAAFLEDALPPKGEWDGMLWQIEARGGMYALQNLYTGQYLGCGGNAALTDEGAKLTFTPLGEGFKVGLGENIAGKTTADSLHFGTANRISFGEASVFRFYEQIGANVFRQTTAPEPGMKILVVYKSGSAHYALTESVYGEGSSTRIETKSVTIPLFAENPDLDGDGQANIADVTLLLSYLSADDETCATILLTYGVTTALLDVNADKTIAIPDVTALLNMLALAVDD